MRKVVRGVRIITEGIKKDREEEEGGMERKVREVQPCGSVSSEESVSYGTLKRDRGRVSATE